MDTPTFQSRGMDGVSCEKGQITVTALSLLAVSEGERLILPKLAQVVNPIIERVWMSHVRWRL